MATVLLTGSEGFIGRYLVRELLSRDHSVIGVDNYSKYGEVRRDPQEGTGYRLVKGDARDTGLLADLLKECDYFVAAAAMIGGLSYLHSQPFDILRTNEQLTIAACEAALRVHGTGPLKRIVHLSSSLVYERADAWPSREGQQLEIPAPLLSYGFQKLAVEYYATSAWKQHGLPYTIIRPFNCVGAGEARALGEREVTSGNIELAMSHVVPDLVKKVLMDQDPLHILGDGSQLRPFTYAGDFARGLATAMEHPAAENEDFNISAPVATSILELAETIWQRIKGPEVPFRFESDPAFEHDVQKRVADVEKAKSLLGFEATTTLDEMLDEVIPWVQDALSRGLI